MRNRDFHPTNPLSSTTTSPKDKSNFKKYKQRSVESSPSLSSQPTQSTIHRHLRTSHGGLSTALHQCRHHNVHSLKSTRLIKLRLWQELWNCWYCWPHRPHVVSLQTFLAYWLPVLHSIYRFFFFNPLYRLTFNTETGHIQTLLPRLTNIFTSGVYSAFFSSSVLV